MTPRTAPDGSVWIGTARVLSETPARLDAGHGAGQTYQALRKPVRPMSEEEFTRRVIAMADENGYLVVHFRPAMLQSGKWVTAMSGDRGFPDLCMARDTGTPRVIVAELKVGRNKPTAAQQSWLDAFRRAGVEAYLWRDTDLGLIERTLK